MSSKASDLVNGRSCRILALCWLLAAFQQLGQREVAASINAEGRALLMFKASIEFDPYGALEHWEEGEEMDPCFWFGVECEEGTVVALSLKDLGLQGKIAPELGRLFHLKSLTLHNNSFFGVIPGELSALQSLEVLDLGHNKLTGPLPSYFSHFSSLRILILTNNGFIDDSMPTDIHELSLSLEPQFGEDALSSSEGQITRNLKHVTSRRLLQLRNHLSAPTPAPPPEHVGKYNKRINNNAPSPAPVPSSRLPFLPPEIEPAVTPSPSVTFPPSPVSHPAIAPSPAPVAEPPKSVPHYQPNFDTAASPFSIPIPSPTGSPSATTADTHKSHATVWIYPSVIGAVSFLLALSAAYILCWRANKVGTIRPWATGLSGQLQKAFITGVPSLRRPELEVACEDFSNIIGSHLGCMLYKGTLSSGVEIAVVSALVKSSKDWSKQSESLFRKKVTMLSKVNHKNFVNLLGYCEEADPFTRMMVFEYAPNGTLFEHLHVKDAEHLDWPTRLRIAMGMAYCLEYMEQLNPPIIVRTLDSSTIYLTDDYAAKLSDMHFSIEGKESELDPARSSPLEAPPDQETVVHRFGILLLEILSSRPLFSEEDGLLEHRASCYLNGEKPFQDLIDPTLAPFSEETTDALREVIRCCIHPDAKKRPTMAEVTRRLRGITAMPPDGATPKVSPLWWAELEIISSEAN